MITFSCWNYTNTRAKFIEMTYFAYKLILIGLFLVKIGLIIKRKLCFNRKYNIPLWILDSNVVHCFLNFVFLHDINFREIVTKAHA